MGRSEPACSDYLPYKRIVFRVVMSTLRKCVRRHRELDRLLVVGIPRELKRFFNRPVKPCVFKKVWLIYAASLFREAYFIIWELVL